MKFVAARARFLKCYDSSTTNIASSVVAAVPRFLKCYDSRRGGDVEQGVAAGPRFLKCYDLIVRTPKPPSVAAGPRFLRSEEHTSELQSLMRISYAVFCLKKNKSKLHTTKQIYKRTIQYINHAKQQLSPQPV